jgi:hypothetical protein
MAVQVTPHCSPATNIGDTENDIIDQTIDSMLPYQISCHIVCITPTFTAIPLPDIAQHGIQ